MQFISILLILLTVINLSYGLYNSLFVRHHDKKYLHAFSGFIEKLFNHEYKQYVDTGVRSAVLDELIETLAAPPEARHQEIAKLPQQKQTPLCALCRSAVSVLLDYRRSGMTDEKLTIIATDLCITLKIQPPHVCVGVIALNLPILVYIADNRKNLTSEMVCGLILQGSNCIIVNTQEFEWHIEIDPNMPKIRGHKHSNLRRSGDELVVLQITDIHYDPRYSIGSNAQCREGTCCRSGNPKTKEDAASRWGDYRRCDVPWETVETLTKHIKLQHPNIDYIYYTGDIVDHGVWETTRELIETSMTRIFDHFRKVFEGIPIFPLLGNHEAQPVNQFPPPDVPDNFTAHWLYEHASREWSNWLSESDVETVKIEGYYTTLVRSGLRIIALNNNHCYTYNWWLLYEPTHPAKQLQWLHDTLLEAETNNEQVHLLVHIPAGEGSCFKVWDREYNRIVVRFWSTISAIFTGHTHFDEFNVFYSATKPNYAVNVAWNGGSVTPYNNLNSNYFVYYIDGATHQVVEKESWIFNLTQANLIPDQTPHWYKSYTFRQEYGVRSLTPSALNGLIEDFASNPAKLKNYWRHKVKHGDTSLAEDCDELCLADHLCQIVTTEFDVTTKCNELMEAYEYAVLSILSSRRGTLN